MKKALILLLAIAQWMFLFPSAMGETAWKVGLCLSESENSLPADYGEALAAYLDSLEGNGASIELFVAEAGNDAAVQEAQVKNLLAQGVRGFILNPVKDSVAVNLWEQMEKAGAPTVLIGKTTLVQDENGTRATAAFHSLLQSPLLCYVGQGEDARLAGRMQGEMIAERRRHGDLNRDGLLSYVMFKSGDSTAAQRTEWTTQPFNDTDVSPRCLLEITTDGTRAQAKALCAEALEQFGEEIEVIFCDSDEVALGVSDALDISEYQVGRDFYMVSIGGAPEAIDLVRQGKLTGTVMVGEERADFFEADILLSALEGEPLADYYWSAAQYVKIDGNYVRAMDADD